MEGSALETSASSGDLVANMDVATSSPTALFEINEARDRPACGHEQLAPADTAPQNGSTRTRPALLRVIPANIPDAVRQRPQWVCWRWTWKTDKEKWDKPPFNARTGEFASSTDKSTWSSFEDAWAAYLNPANQYSGVGYVFSGEADDFIGVVLDDCRDAATGEIRPWTTEQRACKHWASTAPDPAEIIKLLETYAEVSPSGTGVKLLARGALEKGMKRGDFEMYRAGRYFTVTGHRILESPSAIVDNADTAFLFLRVFFAGDDKEKEASKRLKAKKAVARPSQIHGYSPSADAIIAACRRAANAAKFEQLFSGNTSGYQSQSEADLALCSIVAFYAAGQASLVDEVFRRSRLYRDKWDEVHTGDGRCYGEMTVASALDGCTEHYNWQSSAPAAQQHDVAGITLAPVRVHRTASRVTVTLELRREGKAFDLLKLSDAASSRLQCRKSILEHLNDTSDNNNIRTQVDAALGAILVEAIKPCERHASEGKEVHEILAEHVRTDIKLLYLTEKGKGYSDRLRQDISRSAFIERYLNNDIIHRMGAAADCPRDDEGAVIRTQLIGLIEKELKVLWGDMITNLGAVAEAELADDSPVAVAYRKAITSLWVKPASMGIHKQEVTSRDTVQLATRNSLASRVRRLAIDRNYPDYNRWLPLHDAYSAYCRVEKPPNSPDSRMFLAMRYDLAIQIGVNIPDTDDQKTLMRLGAKFGAIDPDPPITTRMTGGMRLAVLSGRLTEDILAEPIDDSPSSLSDDDRHSARPSDDQPIQPSSLVTIENSSPVTIKSPLIVTQ